MTEGIDSLSLSLDSQLKTMAAIVDLEKTLTRGASETARDAAQAPTADDGSLDSYRDTWRPDERTLHR